MTQNEIKYGSKVKSLARRLKSPVKDYLLDIVLNITYPFKKNGTLRYTVTVKDHSNRVKKNIVQEFDRVSQLF